MAEYRAVLTRPKFDFDPADIDSVLVQIEADGFSTVARPLISSLPDPDDVAFLEVALASSAEVLVTGNRRHFPRDRCRGVCVMSPAELIETLK